MKNLIILLIFLGVNLPIMAQTYKVDLFARALKNQETAALTIADLKEKGQSHFKKGDKLHISEIGYENESYYLLINEMKFTVSSNILEKIDFQYKNVQDLWNAQIIKNVLVPLQKKGIQNDLRADMESDALEYINKVKAYNLELNDPYLENYIYSLIAKIAPVTIIDGRPGNVNLLILNDPSINACIYPNGTLVINTGLLANLHSEDELVAILGHEIAHFILDHSVHNVNKNITRQKRATFWSALAVGVTAVAEGVVASKNKYYVPGAATLGMTMLSSSIASQVIDRLGMKYNHEQEMEADKIAQKVLSILNYDVNALATALNRLRNTMIIERSNEMYFSSYSHPALVERIKNAGVPQQTIDSSFEQKVSFAVTNTARLKFEDRRFRQCLTLATQNIINRVATSEDYILKASCLLALNNDLNSNNEIMNLVSSAKAIDPQNINVYKVEILANLRLGNKVEAINLLEEYCVDLDKMELQLKEIESDAVWESISSYILSEKDWAMRMQVKLKGML